MCDYVKEERRTCNTERGKSTDLSLEKEFIAYIESVN